MEDLLAGELELLAMEIAGFVPALELQRRHGLLTNDSLHLAAGKRHGLNLLATADQQLAGIPGWTVFQPDDL